MCDPLPVTDPVLMQYVASCWVTRCVIAQGLYNHPVAHTVILNSRSYVIYHISSPHGKWCKEESKRGRMSLSKLISLSDNMEYKHREGGGDFLHLQLDIDIDEGGGAG